MCSELCALDSCETICHLIQQFNTNHTHSSSIHWKWMDENSICSALNRSQLISIYFALQYLCSRDMVSEYTFFFAQLWASTSKYWNRKLDEQQKKVANSAYGTKRWKKARISVNKLVLPITWVYSVHRLAYYMWVCVRVSGSIWILFFMLRCVLPTMANIWKMCVQLYASKRNLFISFREIYVFVWMWHLNVIIQTWNP